MLCVMAYAFNLCNQDKRQHGDQGQPGPHRAANATK